MKTEVIKEIREKSLEQLYKDINSFEKELREIRFKTVNREVKDFNQKMKLKKKMARYWTVIHEKEYAKIVESIK
ncbi:MAG TPA: 50S ribosomal protein L29 [Patescibacteria group bacterium]|nr:50S ribosomal protein L29 [Patescibacteria group bacterium]